MKRGILAILGLVVAISAAGADDRLHCTETDPVAGQSIDAKPKALIPGKTIWLKPGGAFSFKVECKERLPRQYRLWIEMFEGDQPAATADVLVARNRPLTLTSIRQTWKIWVE